MLNKEVIINEVNSGALWKNLWLCTTARKSVKTKMSFNVCLYKAG